MGRDRERTCGEGRGRFPSQCRSPFSKTESGRKACRRLPPLVYMVTCTDHAQMYVHTYRQTDRWKTKNIMPLVDWRHLLDGWRHNEH